MREGLLGASSYAKTSKELIDFAGKIRALGAPADLHLPRVVVIGNQSAGKSSLVEAISGIHVPRDAGTCTRCPMECRLNHAPERWSCQIYLRWEVDDRGRRLQDIREVPFGERITDPQVVEPMLRRAQAAVLNPAVDTAKILDLSDQAVRDGIPRFQGQPPALLFSKNVVCVELEGPGLVDLSFVDLPGIVQNAEEDVVQLVEELVTSYIGGQCLILLTLPMIDDIENQAAARFAKLADPEGVRTIGVVTKPDMLAVGSTKARDLWKDVLEGRRHPLTHGYYCTRQPDDDERANGISPSEARELESRFFEETTPWATSTHKHRFGTENLVQNLSTLLTRIIHDEIPILQDKVSAQLLTCEAALAKLPPPITTEPSAFVLGLITTFCAEVKEHVRGTPTQMDLVQRNRRTYDAFKLAIRSTAPPFVPYESEAKAKQKLQDYVLPAPTTPKTVKKKHKQDGVAPGTGGIMYLPDLHNYVEACKARELPNNVPYSGKIQLILEFQHTWGIHFQACCDQVEEAFKETLQELIHRQIDRYGPLKAVLAPAVMQLVTARREETIKYLQIILELEKEPYTQNTHYLSAGHDKRLAAYKDARAGKTPAEPVTPAVPSSVSSPLSLITAQAHKPNGALSASSTAFVPGQPAPATTAPTSPTVPTSTKLSSFSFNPAAASFSVGGFKPKIASPAAAPARGVTGSPQSQSAESFIDAAEKEELTNTALSVLAQLGYAGLTADDLGKLNPADEYERELDLMAEVRAYFQVAYKRVIDYVPMSVDRHLLYAFCDALQGVLFERLGLGGENASARCAAYIAEDVEIAARREEFGARRKRLGDVQDALFNFGL